jgi:hypothetical protein
MLGKADDPSCRILTTRLKPPRDCVSDLLERGVASWRPHPLHGPTSLAMPSLCGQLHLWAVSWDSICHEPRCARTRHSANTQRRRLDWGLPAIARESDNSGRGGGAWVCDYRSGGVPRNRTWGRHSWGPTSSAPPTKALQVFPTHVPFTRTVINTRWPAGKGGRGFVNRPAYGARFLSI